MFKGSIVALVTPFQDGVVDYEKLDALVEFHIEKGTDAIVPCGTTGESAAMDRCWHASSRVDRDRVASRERLEPGWGRRRLDLPAREDCCRR